MSTDWINDLLPQIIPFVVANFALSMFAIAAFFMILHRLVTMGRVSQYEIAYRWIAFFAVGITGLYAFVMQSFYPAASAEMLGWVQSPFQYQVAMADLGFGLIAVLSFNASYGFRLATVFANACWLWGDASGHIYQIVVAGNLRVGDSGSWFWMDLLLPLILFLCIGKLKPASA
jgi:hypothetical protein